MRQVAEPLHGRPAGVVCERGDDEAAVLHDHDERAVCIRGERADHHPVRRDEPRAAGDDPGPAGRWQRQVRVPELQPPERGLQRDGGVRPAGGLHRPVPGAVWDLQHRAERGDFGELGLEDDPERDAAAHHFDAVPAPRAAAEGVAADERDGGSASHREVERLNDARVLGVGGGCVLEQAVEPAGRDQSRVDFVGEQAGALEGLDAHFRAEGARRHEAEGEDFGGEHHAGAEHFGLGSL